MPVSPKTHRPDGTPKQMFDYPGMEMNDYPVRCLYCLGAIFSCPCEKPSTARVKMGDDGNVTHRFFVEDGEYFGEWVPFVGPRRSSE